MISYRNWFLPGTRCGRGHLGDGFTTAPFGHGVSIIGDGSAIPADIGGDGPPNAPPLAAAINDERGGKPADIGEPGGGNHC
jgi:hypothetical protein